MATKDSGKKQVFDVSHPGTSAPSATSKPIITGSGAIMKDPMVQDNPADAQSDSGESTSEVSKTKKGKTLQPLHDDITSESDEDAPQEENVNVTVKSESSPAPEKDGEEDIDSAKPELEDATSAPEESTDEPEDTAEPKNAIVDAVLDQNTGGKNSTKKVADDVDNSIQEHIQNKTYFVKISHASTSNTLSVLIILTLLLVIAGIFYVADQRGIITLPF